MILEMTGFGFIVCSIFIPIFSRSVYGEFIRFSCLGTANILWAISALARDSILLAIWCTAWGAFSFWLAWRMRPPRKRRASRIFARVKVAGHRLTVVPVGA